MTREPLTEIAARATTLWERAAIDAPPRPTPPDVLSARFSRWQQVAAGGDARRFRRYLTWSNLTESSARRALAAPQAPPDRCHEWLAIVEMACRIAIDNADAIAGGDDLPHDLASSQPFAELMVPFVSAARRCLMASAGARYAELAPTAQAQLEAALLTRLARVADRPLYVEFATFRSHVAAWPDGWRTSSTMVFQPAGNVAYRAFVRDVLADGFAGVFRRHPVLARLMAVCAQVWVDATAELLAALAADRPALETTFGGHVALGAVAHLTPYLSDPHRGGRTVCRVQFESGRELVYKPHSTGPEAAFASVLAWLNDREPALSLRAPATYDCGTHGWTEAVTARPCANGAETTAYQRRAGMLVCLAYVLGSSDLHGANVIASGAFPVLVDLEVMMTARPRIAGPDGDSVLRTGLLPAAHMGRDGAYHRGGALMPADRPRPRRRWRYVNSDRMTSETVPELPAADGPIGDAGQARTALPGNLAIGFREMFLALRRHRAELAAPGGPLVRARDERYRVILRSTAAYASLLDRALHPAHLRDGADWSIELEQLKAGATQAVSRPALWPALVSERVALERLDIPVFESEATGTALHTFERGSVPRFSAETPYRATLRRLARLDEHDLAAQTHLMRVAVALGEGEPRAAAEGDRYVSAALAIGRRLRCASFQSSSGEINWMGATRAPGRSRHDVTALGWDLYSGRPGVALLFAALWAVTSDARARTLAIDIVQPLVARARVDGRRIWLRRLGAVGRGGLIYALARIGPLVDASPLVDAATTVARAITPRMIDRGRDHDVVFGTAGALLGLLALHDVTGDRHVLDRAHWCGRRLLAAAGSRARPDGFAHGMAGMAYSVARLYRTTGDARYRHFALDAWLPAHAGTRARARSKMLRHSWCRGSSGVALSRVGCSMLAEAPHLRNGAVRLVDQIVSDAAPASDVDHACCGHAGRICLLSTAGRALARPEWTAAATAAADRMLDRRSHRTIYTLGVSDDVLAPGFFQGLAGIGYELLRFRSDRLPSVLLLE